jgi:hypothetical protein
LAFLATRYLALTRAHWRCWCGSRSDPFPPWPSQEPFVQSESRPGLQSTGGDRSEADLVAAVPDEKIVAALSVIFDVRNHPILIHCNKGKVRLVCSGKRSYEAHADSWSRQHRTGCLVGCLRKAQQWSTAAIFDEYRRYSFPKSRSIDQQYIEAFDGVRPHSLRLFLIHDADPSLVQLPEVRTPACCRPRRPD